MVRGQRTEDVKEDGRKVGRRWAAKDVDSRQWAVQKVAV